MASRVRTIEFLPEIFRTKPNEKFLTATLDQLVTQPNTTKIQGFIGSKFGYGVKNTDAYIVENNKIRTNYQLDPSVVFLKDDTSVPKDALTYPGLVDSIKVEGGFSENHNDLFSNQFYSWDSFVDLDKAINFNHYFWLPEGPEAVTVSAGTNYLQSNFLVRSLPDGYLLDGDNIKLEGYNPIVTLLRGGTYKFKIKQDNNFWIQSTPDGLDPINPNVSTRDIYGIENNGINDGTVTFNVPAADSFDESLLPNTQRVDLLSTKKFDDINGKRVSQVGDIDGITNFIGKTVVFYGYSPFDKGYFLDYYDDKPYDIDSWGGNDETIFNKNIYYINVTNINDPDPVIKIERKTSIIQMDRITILSGAKNQNRQVYADRKSYIKYVTGLTSKIDTLYYVDEKFDNRIGIIKIVDANVNGEINVEKEILNKLNYTSPNNVTFTNGLKVYLTGKIYPPQYQDKEFYIEGVGTAIKLLPVTDFVVPEKIGQSTFTAWNGDVLWDDQPWDGGENIPTIKDYITINRASADLNAWTRSNRWFHADVLTATAKYRNNNSPIVLNALNNPEYRAKRPVIEFYPNLKLFNSGSIGRQATYIDYVTTDPFGKNANGEPVCQGATVFYPNNDDEPIFSGATIIFVNATDINVRNKIYSANIERIVNGGNPVVNLTIAANGDMSSLNQAHVMMGQFKGNTIYFDGTHWKQGQQKNAVNVPPRFDLYNNSDVSFGDQSYYYSSDFIGCTLFEYAPGTGVDDTVLGFPIKYSSTSNLGDILFNVSLNTQFFNYVDGLTPKKLSTGTGYVHEYIPESKTFKRKIGWQTAVDDSFQYQSFEFTVKDVNFFTLDIPYKDPTTTNWPVTVVYVDNSRLSVNDYTRTINGDNQTVITLNTQPKIGTTVQILVYSDVPSEMGYYQIPNNLQNNPFNDEITEIALGDIRGHYKSICNNITKLSGLAFGPNNYRDLGNLVPYGTRIIQNSAGIPAMACFLRSQDYSILNSLIFNEDEYVKYKSTLVDTVNNLNLDRLQTDSELLDLALQEVAYTKNDSSAFFYSDMVPTGDKFASNTYTKLNYIKQSQFPLTRIYDFSKASYYGVLVYITKITFGVTVKEQLMRGIDYDISADEPKVTIYRDLQNGDQVTVDEYYKTYGSFVPNTPTKMGLYPASVPAIVFLNTYVNQGYFIQGHDGSLTKLYGDYENNTLIDFRDRVLFEFEKRIYNNLKLSNIIPLTVHDIMPGQFRSFNYSYEEYIRLYSEGFLNWVGKNRISYKTQYFDITQDFTYNYLDSVPKLQNSDNTNSFKQGNWKGIYLHYYDTTTPHITPWEMLGMTIKPVWWDSRYGEAPYTSDNELLWTDLEKGYNYNNGDGYVDDRFKRPGLSQIIPVSNTGELIIPSFVMVSYLSNSSTLQRDWVVGDVGPAEFSYLKSSTWPFDLMRLFVLLKPAKFFGLCLNVDTYEYNTEFKQYLENSRYRSPLRDLEIYGNGVATHSYVNWIVDYINQLGKNGYEQIKKLVSNVDVRLTYRVAGFTDKDMLKLYVEKGSPNSKNNSLLIPDENYTVLLYNNQPFDRVSYSSVIVQKTSTGYKVFGNGQTYTYFKTFTPRSDGLYQDFLIGSVTIKLSRNFTQDIQIIPYGTEFSSVQALCEFLQNYGRYLQNQGFVYDNVENNIVVNWSQMIAEVLYWSQIGWDAGGLINVNPSATTIKFDKENSIIQPLTVQRQNYILNQNLLPISIKDMSIDRNGTTFQVSTLSTTDTFNYMTAEVSNFEHIVILDNVTAFNDVLYNLTTGLRQQRLFVKGVKTAEWNGYVDTPGFILNQDNVEEWKPNNTYSKGTIVTYKNYYWVATELIKPSVAFDETLWIKTDYDKIQKGLLSNPSTKSVESLYYYDVNTANLENEGDLLGFSLIGYRPRDYLASANLDDVTQVNVFKNMIEGMGTNYTVSQLKNIKVPQGTLDYDLYENWVIKYGDFGGVLNNNFITFKLDQALLTGNPSIAGVYTDEKLPDSVQQPLMAKELESFGRPIMSSNILPHISASYSNKIPDAGYVNLNDVQVYSYAVSGLSNNQDICNLYNSNYVWLADYRGEWRLYTPQTLKSIDINLVLESFTNNYNGTATLTFNTAHNLVVNDIVGFLNFGLTIDGYYTISNIPNSLSLTIEGNFGSTVIQISNGGILYKLIPHRLSQPSDAGDLNAVINDFNEIKIWTDKDKDGEWAVYQKENRYKYELELSISENIVSTFKLGENAFLVGLDNGIVKQYQYLREEYQVVNQINEGGKFGQTIARGGRIIAISDPSTGTVRLYSTFFGTSIYPLIEQQTLSLDTETGYSIAISKDDNWIYISDHTRNLVQTYQKSLYTYSSELGVTITPQKQDDKIIRVDGYLGLVSGTLISFVNANNEKSEPYTVLTVYYNNDDDFTRINLVEPLRQDIYAGQSFVRATYNYIPSNSIGYYQNREGDNFGYKVSCNYDGTIVTIAAPNQDFDGLYETWYPNRTYAVGTVIFNIDTFYLAFEAVPAVFNFSEVLPHVSVLDNVGYVHVFERCEQKHIATHTYSSWEGPTITTILPLTEGRPESIVTVNGRVLKPGIDFNQYGYLVYLYGSANVKAGDVITVSSSSFAHRQTLKGYQSDDNIRNNTGFGVGHDMNVMGNEIVVGAPYYIIDNVEGYAFRYTDTAKTYGIVKALYPTYIAPETVILINGYPVTVDGGTNSVVKAINEANIPNVIAYTENNRLVISLRDQSLADPNNRLNITAFDVMYSQLGFMPYVQTQTFSDIYKSDVSKFGHSIAFNEQNSFVVGAPMVDTKKQATFDFTDDAVNNDTVFDNGFTRFIDTISNAGTVHMYDFLPAYNQSLTNPGKFVYAQSLTDKLSINQYDYGNIVKFYDFEVLITSKQGNQNKFTVYKNTEKASDWKVYRKGLPVIDINGLQGIHLFDNKTNNNVKSLDLIDPLQGRFFGVVNEALDVISSTDPAGYNNEKAMVWGQKQVGTLWLNTYRMKYINYHQNDISYNSAYWAKLFPGSDPSVYTWIESSELPLFYTGPGTPYDLEKYVTSVMVNNTGEIIPKYYYWVRNTGVIYSQRDKKLSDTIIEQYINNPETSGFSYFAAYSPNIFGFYNINEYLSGNDTSIHITYGINSDKDSTHSEFKLIRENYSDDFLPGIPEFAKRRQAPTGLYDRLLDSFCGIDEKNSIVPDPNLPFLMKRGTSVRPRQSMFVNRHKALENYLGYANNILAKYPIFEMRNPRYLTREGNKNPSTQLPFYNVSDTWNYIDWWAEGYSSATRPSYSVSRIYDLYEIENPTEGLVVSVLQNSEGKREIYIHTNNNWERISLENGTIKFKDLLWNYDGNNIGWGDNSWDNEVWDKSVSDETRFVIRSLNEEIFTNDLLVYRNQGLILLFKFIESENIEGQNYLPWLNKTSFVDVSHTVRELKQYENYLRDNIDLITGYVNEVKPYHVVIKEFIYKYSGIDDYNGAITDFDLPAKFDFNLGRFITPSLKYNSTTEDNEFYPDDKIWKTPEYQSWYNNQGLTISGDKDFIVSLLVKEIASGSTQIYLQNTNGLPVEGYIKINDEIIFYSKIDRVKGILQTIYRGMYDTPVQTHPIGSTVYMDLPGAIVLESGRAYQSPPAINAVIDTTIYPAPREIARFRPIMNLDRVVAVEVLSQGSGYAITPTIEIEPSFVLSFDNTKVNYISNIISIDTTSIQGKLYTGDCLKYKVTDGLGILGLQEDSFYYVRVFSSPNFVKTIALYSTALDSELDNDRIKLLQSKNSFTATLSMCARIELISNLSSARGITPTLTFDRTSYRPLVTPWKSGNFYGSGLSGINTSSAYLVSLGQKYADLPKENRDNSLAALFNIYSLYFVGDYVVEIVQPGQDFQPGQVITIPATDMGSTWIIPDNNCYITVDTVDENGGILTATASGKGLVIARGSIQGIQLNVDDVIQTNTYADVFLSSTTTNVAAAQLTGLKLDFYRSRDPYIYDDTNDFGAKIVVYNLKFTNSGIINQYDFTITSPGSKYAVGQQITISGSSLGGNNIINDATITVKAVNSTGGITLATISGNSVATIRSYYVVPVSATRYQVYNDINLSVRTTFANFPFTPADGAIVSSPATAMSGAKFNFSSFVAYAGKLWMCIENNNDIDFDPAKWREMRFDDVMFNALDRYVGAYEPSANDPGKNLNNIFKGLTYSNNVYRSNPFSPENSYELDIVLQGQDFKPTNMSIRGLIYDTEKFVGISDNVTESALLLSTDGKKWTTQKVSPEPLNTTSVNSINGLSFFTADNKNAPVYVSGYTSDYRVTGMNYSANKVIKSSIDQKYYIAGNQVIQSSLSAINNWAIAYDSTSNLITFTDIIESQIPGFVGLVAVGKQITGVINNITQYIPVILVNVDSQNWSKLSISLGSFGLNKVCVGSNIIVGVGTTGSIVTSTNGLNFTKQNSPTTRNLNNIIYANNMFTVVGDNGTILTSIDGISWTVQASGTTKNLYAIAYDGTNYIVGGDNATILSSTNSTTWAKSSAIELQDPDYTVSGGDFTYGYAPEEMVAGIVSDNLSMYVKTAPSGGWDYTVYGHTGFNIKSVTRLPDNNLQVSFSNLLEVPSTIGVFIINSSTGQGYRIYENITDNTNTSWSYSTNWVSKRITLIPLSGNTLGDDEIVYIEVYEVGAGLQLSKGSTDDTTLILDKDLKKQILILGHQYDSNLPSLPVVYHNGTRLTYIEDYYMDSTEQGLARLVFTNTYTLNDYITYATFGSTVSETNTNQYWYSLPEMQVFTGNGTKTVFALDNNIQYTTPFDNTQQTDINTKYSIVEVNGLRKFTTSDITYNFVPNFEVKTLANTVGGVFTFSRTTYPDIQYVKANAKIKFGVSPTEYVITNSTSVSSTVWQITIAESVLLGANITTYISATIEFAVAPADKAIVAVTTFNDTREQSLNLNRFAGGYEVLPVIYVDNNTTPVRISLQNAPSAGGYSDDTIIRIDGLLGSNGLNNQTFYVEYLTDTLYALYRGPSKTQPVNSLQISDYIDQGYVWKESQNFQITNSLAMTNGPRSFVTINGNRLDNKKLRYQTSNKRLNILTRITPTDIVCVTSMISTGTPNQLTYNLIVNKNNEPSVYKASNKYTTYLTQDLYLTQDTIYLSDIDNAIQNVQQTSIVMVSNGIYYTPLQANITDVRDIVVTVTNKFLTLNKSVTSVSIYNNAPVIIFDNSNNALEAGDTLRITMRLGNYLVINGETIKFEVANYSAGTVSKLTRGSNGTPALYKHSKYSMVHALSEANKLDTIDYYQNWNNVTYWSTEATVLSSTTNQYVFTISTNPNIVKVKVESDIRFGSIATTYRITGSFKNPNNSAQWIIQTTNAPAVDAGTTAYINYILSSTPLQLSNTEAAKFLKS